MLIQLVVQCVGPLQVEPGVEEACQEVQAKGQEWEVRAQHLDQARVDPLHLRETMWPRRPATITERQVGSEPITTPLDSPTLEFFHKFYLLADNYYNLKWGGRFVVYNKSGLLNKLVYIFL